jgi:hypothetical protein
VRNTSTLPYGALGLCAVAALLAACSSLGSSSSSFPSTDAEQSGVARVVSMIPIWLQPTRGQRILHELESPAKKKKPPKGGFYVSEFYGANILGYPNPNDTNGPPTCMVAAAYINGFGVDPKGALIAPSGSARTVNVYHGPKLCEPLSGSFADNFGQPADAASLSALTSTIIVGNITTGSQSTGSVSICTLKGGCTANLTNASITGFGGGVALAKNGDCWMSAEKQSFSGFVLVYWKGCAGGGQVATGTKNTYYGGLTIDNKGNLISVDLSGSIYVYSGCNPACTVVGGPFGTEGDSLFGGLNKKADQFVVGDYADTQADVYTYSPTKITFSYDFDNGLTSGDDSEGAAFSPANKL